LPDEIALFAEAQNSGEPSDGLMLVYLVELDGEESVDPDDLPPAQTWFALKIHPLSGNPLRTRWGCDWITRRRRSMPLVSDGKPKPVLHNELRAFGFWMTVKGAIPVRPARIFVSYEALADLDPLDIRDLASAFKHFERFRTRIETAASDKFDRHGPDADKYEGMPTIRLSTNDPI
jgi:hypothetical protein